MTEAEAIQIQQINLAAIREQKRSKGRQPKPKAPPRPPAPRYAPATATYEERLKALPPDYLPVVEAMKEGRGLASEVAKQAFLTDAILVLEAAVACQASCYAGKSRAERLGELCL